MSKAALRFRKDTWPLSVERSRSLWTVSYFSRLERSVCRLLCRQQIECGTVGYESSSNNTFNTLEYVWQVRYGSIKADVVRIHLWFLEQWENCVRACRRSQKTLETLVSRHSRIVGVANPLETPLQRRSSPM